MKSLYVKTPIILLLGLLMIGCVQNTVPEEYTPDQREIVEVMTIFRTAWNKRDLNAMRDIYTKDSPELAWVEKNLKSNDKRISVRVKDVVVFGNDAFATISVSGGWSSRELASFIKEDGRWKLEFRTKSR